jgi:hypothetical protein
MRRQIGLVLTLIVTSGSIQLFTLSEGKIRLENNELAIPKGIVVYAERCPIEHLITK